MEERNDTYEREGKGKAASPRNPFVGGGGFAFWVFCGKGPIALGNPAPSMRKIMNPHPLLSRFAALHSRNLGPDLLLFPS